MAYRGGKREKAQLVYDKDWYYYSTLSMVRPPIKEVRQEYSRLRSIARKRFERMGKNEQFNKTQTYQNYKGGFPTLKELKSDEDLFHEISQLARVVSSNRSSIRGMKIEQERTLETLHENQLSFVNDKNIQDFGRFMEAYRQQHIDLIYDSERVAALFNIAEEKGVNHAKIQNDFEFWIKNDKLFENTEIKKTSKTNEYNRYKKEVTKQANKQSRSRRKSRRKR